MSLARASLEQDGKSEDGSKDEGGKRRQPEDAELRRIPGGGEVREDFRRLSYGRFLALIA